MAKPSPSVTETELAILDVLWEQGPSMIRGITARLYGEEYSTSQYTTVKSLLERLESKRYVTRNRRSFAHVFSVRVERDSFIGQQLNDLADRVCGGSLKPLFVNLVERMPLTNEERQRLRKMIDKRE